MVVKSKKSGKSVVFHSGDRDLLVSIILQKRAFKFISLSRNKSTFLKGRIRTGQRRNLKIDWSIDNPRNVLSWLIHSKVLSLGEKIRLCNLKDGTEYKKGSVTKEGILCACCNKVLSIFKFKRHPVSELNPRLMDLVMDSRKPLILCQLEAWAAEYKVRRARHRTIGTDEQDDLCGYCGKTGKLVYCDNCPATFHRSCLLKKKIGEGSWYCPQCCCRTCSNVVKEIEVSLSYRARKCSLCKYKYHEKCMQGSASSASDTWFCQKSCYEMLRSLNIQKLLMPAPEEVVDMWITKFGFRQLEGNEKQNIKTVGLMLLPGSIWFLVES